MIPFEQISATGVYRDEATQCFAAWQVDLQTGEKMLVSTCSMGVPEEQYHWWAQQVWRVWFSLYALPAAA